LPPRFSGQLEPRGLPSNPRPVINNIKRVPMSFHRYLQRFFVVLALCLIAAAPAHAKRGLMLINTGDELFEVAAFPEDVIKQIPKANAAKVGYKCNHFGIFWADVWTWDCKMVAMLDENSYADLPDDIATRLAGDAQYSLGHAKRGLWNHYAFWVLIAAVLAVLAWTMLPGSKKKEADEADAQPA
jgi:hypothetical protein